MDASDYETLQKNDILKDCLPDLVNNFTAQGVLEVQYEKPEVNVHMGNELLPSDTQVVPTITYLASTPVDLQSTYTIIMTDPDVPSRLDNSEGEVCHFVATGIKFDSVKGGVVSGQGVARRPYIGPAPAKNTALHRYVFMLLKEPKGKTEFTEIKSIFSWGYGEAGTGIDRWSKENGLEVLAINFFFAENEANDK